MVAYSDRVWGIRLQNFIILKACRTGNRPVQQISHDHFCINSKGKKKDRETEVKMERVGDGERSRYSSQEEIVHRQRELAEVLQVL